MPDAIFMDVQCAGQPHPTPTRDSQFIISREEATTATTIEDEMYEFVRGGSNMGPVE